MAVGAAVGYRVSSLSVGDCVGVSVGVPGAGVGGMKPATVGEEVGYRVSWSSVGDFVGEAVGEDVGYKVSPSSVG